MDQRGAHQFVFEKVPDLKDKDQSKQFKKKARNRSTIVCTNCKRLKTKCDMKSPCMKCITTNKADTCTYLALSSANIKHPGTFNVLRQSNEMYLSSQIPNGKKNASVSSGKQQQAQQQQAQQAQYSSSTFIISKSEKLASKHNDLKHQDIETPLEHSQTIEKQNSSLYEITKTFQNIKETSNLVLDSKLWNSTVMTSSYTDFAFDHKANPLIFPSNMWGDRDFVYLAKELFEPMLKLYFKKWINVKKISHIRTDLSYNANQNDINEAIVKLKPYFIDNYNAILERVLYFKTDVAPLAFKEYINDELIDSIVKEFLDFDKLLYYNQISHTLFEACFVLEMVDLANTFKALDTKSQFRYNITPTFENLNETVIMLLKYQSSNERSNFLALLTTIITTFKTYYFSDNSFSGISEELTYPGFRELLGTSFQLNFHLPCKNLRSQGTNNRIEKYKNYKIDQTAICKIWNRFQKVDATLSVKLRTPLLISYDFCEEHHILDPNDLVDKLDNEFVLLNRKFAYLLNSKNGTTYRSFIEVDAKVITIYKKLGNFRDVTNLDINSQFIFRNERRWFDLKLITIKGVFFCSTLLSERLKRTKILESFPNYDFNSQEYEEIKHIRGLAKIKSYLIFIYILRIIEVVSSPNAIDPALLFCIKKDLVTWFGFASFSLLDNITSFDEEEINDSYSPKIDVFTYSVNDLENLITDDKRINDIYQHNKLDFKEYKKLSKLLMQVYRTTSHNRIISSSFDYFVKSKVLTLVSYILLVFDEFKRNQKNLSNANLYNVISNLMKERMRAFQSAKGNIKRDSLLRLVVNYDDADSDRNLVSNSRNISDQYSNFSNTSTFTSNNFSNNMLHNYNNVNIPDIFTQSNHQLNEQNNDVTSGVDTRQQANPLMNIPPENLDLSRLPPEELINMIRLFINDERFTAYITQLGTEDPIG